ncbi:MAG TPA: type II toxin-antitoxin system VapC family toxin [Actinomycetota bacterium]|nr:type II toxin-antitoxin system VapC family toxin [Actinomycetota bacterium]
MRIYLDSSAIVKLVQREPESEALRRFLRRRRSDQLVTSALSRVEVVRAVLPGGGLAVSQARRQLGRLDLITVTGDLLDRAATLSPTGSLRSLDAIHLAAAQEVGADLRAIVTYDRRMAGAAADVGLAVEAPA